MVFNEEKSLSSSKVVVNNEITEIALFHGDTDRVVSENANEQTLRGRKEEKTPTPFLDDYVMLADDAESTTYNVAVS